MVGGLLVAAVLVAFQTEATITFLAGPMVRHGDVSSILGRLAVLAGEMSAGIDVPMLIRVSIAAMATFGIASAALAAWLLWRGDADRTDLRLVAGLLLASSAHSAVLYLFDGLARFHHAAERLGRGLDAVEFGLTFFVLLGIARFMCIFPRPVEGDLVRRTYYGRGLGRLLWRHPERATLLPGWHFGLVAGWLVPVGTILAVLANLAAGQATALWPWDGWGGLWVTFYVVGVVFYFPFGLPYAYASLTHLRRFGTDPERERVGRIRSIMLALAVVYAVASLGLLAMIFAHAAPAVLLFFLVAVTTLWTLLPQVLVLGLALAVLPGGELDPRLAFTRITAWTLLGFILSVVFLVVERFLALRLVHWFGLSPNSGAVAAGAVVAASFVPLRQFLTVRMDRLAGRLIPLQVLAAGAQVERAVLITDLSGYTALSAVDEAAARLQSAALSRLGSNAAEKGGGRLVKSLGDAVMLLFPDAASAMRAARELHREFPRAAEVLGLEPLPLHSAIHAGTLVETRDGDIFGQTVNITARMVNAAKSGEIVLSDAARGQLPEPGAFEAIGAQQFKNVPQPVDCYRLMP